MKELLSSCGRTVHTTHSDTPPQKTQLMMTDINHTKKILISANTPGTNDCSTRHKAEGSEGENYSVQSLHDNRPSKYPHHHEQLHLTKKTY